MPKKTRPPEAVEKVKKDILDCALVIIADEGFYGMSMRRLADSIGIAAKTIYNYFSSKEEIYLLVLIRGFELIVEEIEKSLGGIDDPVDRLRAMCHAYIAFGLKNVNYYNIMFEWDVPKYRDYRGTVMEPIATAERDKAFKLIEMAQGAIAAIRMGKSLNPEELQYRALKLWTELHGAVSLCNSHGLHELYDSPDKLVGKFIEDAIRPMLERE